MERKNKQQIKAVFFDIDGTLLGLKSKGLAASTVEALTLLKQQGIRIFVSTGRSYEHAIFLKEFNFDGYITFNGSYCVNADGKAIFRHIIDQQELHALHQYLEEKRQFPVGVMTTEGSFINLIDDEVRSMFHLLKLEVPEPKSFSEALNADVLQLNLFVNEEDEHSLLSDVLPNCVASRWSPLFADVNAKGISKRVGMDKFLQQFDIDPQETMAFGDGGNDIEMLKRSGIGIAMANAGENVKRHADYITTTTEEDGIWKALKAFQIL